LKKLRVENVVHLTRSLKIQDRGSRSALQHIQAQLSQMIHSLGQGPEIDVSDPDAFPGRRSIANELMSIKHGTALTL
jgi:hypothetical protein